MSISCQFISKIFISTSMILLVGCSTAPQFGRLPLLDKIKDRIDRISLPIHLPATAAIKDMDPVRFNICMAPLSAKLRPGFIQLLRSIKADASGANAHLFNRINEIGDEDILDDQHGLHPVLNHLFDRLLNEVTLSQTAADGKLAEINNQFMEKFKADQDILKVDTQEVTLRAKDYLLAYFTKGALQTVTQSLQDKDLKVQLAAVLKRKTEDPAVDKALQLIDKQLVKASAKIPSPSGFIARDGTQYSFPGIQFEDQHVDIDHSQIGADVIRILLEALRDTYAPLPSLTTATAINSKTAKQLLAYKLEFDKNNTAQLAWQLDPHNQQLVEHITISNQDFQKIEAHARQAEAFVASNIGKVIRGGSWGALNNEAVAKLVETVAGVIARHVTERAQWCVQAQLPPKA